MDTTKQNYESGVISRPIGKFLPNSLRSHIQEEITKDWDKLYEEHLKPIIDSDAELKKDFEDVNNLFLGYTMNDDFSNLYFYFNHENLSKYGVHQELFIKFKQVESLFRQVVILHWDSVPSVDLLTPEKSPDLP